MLDLFELFCKDILEHYTHKGYFAELVKTPKNNVTLTSLSISDNANSAIRAVIHLDDIFAECNSTDYAYCAIDKILSNIPSGTFDKEYEDAKEELAISENSLFVSLVSTNGNEEFLKNFLTRQFMDLSIVVKSYCNFADESASIYVHKGMLNMFDGLTEDEIIDRAIANTVNVCGEFYVTGIEKVIAKILANQMCIPVCEAERMLKEHTNAETNDILPMFVLTNSKGLFGSSALVCGKETFKKVADKFDDDLYIIPSSIHELILVPASAMENKEENVDALKNMIREVNETTVNPVEKLSDNLYFYSRNNDTINFAK